MYMLQKKEDTEKLKEDWPLHYYEIDEVLLRRKLLEEHAGQEESRTLLISCADTRAYRTALFGMIDLGDRITAMRIAEEIDTVTGIYPDSLDCRELFLPLREVMIQAYRDILNDGDALWKEYEDR
jgi:hypothetical protein